MHTIAEVTSLLERQRQRATYKAVAGVVGKPPQSLMRGQPQSFRNSWIVSKLKGLPTGYEATQMHPDLLSENYVISDPNELKAWIQNQA